MGYFSVMNSHTTSSSQPPESDIPLNQRPLFVVLNSGSGQHQGPDAEEVITTVLTEAGRQVELVPVSDSRRLATAARRAVRLARTRQGIVVAAGGDGTLNAVSQALVGTGLPLGVVPLGTFNYFARNHGLPQDTEAAAHCLLDARLQPVHAGFLNDRIFLVNASLGLYPHLLEDREGYKRRLGRNRLVALFSALATLMHVHRVLKVDIEVDGQIRHLRTVSMVVSSNALQLEHLGIELADEVQAGQLAAMLVKPIGRGALYGLLLRGLLRRLGKAENLQCFPFSQLRVHRGRRRRIKVALDGEITRLKLPLQFRAAPDCLSLLVPRDPTLRVRE